MENELTGGSAWIMWAVSAIVAADGETARWSVGRFGRANFAAIVFDVAGGPSRTVGLKNRQHSDGAAEIIGDEQEFSGRMEAHISRPGTAGRNGIEQLQFVRRLIDCEALDRAFFVVAHAIGFVGGIQSRPARIQARQLGLVPCS